MKFEIGIFEYFHNFGEKRLMFFLFQSYINFNHLQYDKGIL